MSLFKKLVKNPITWSLVGILFFGSCNKNDQKYEDFRTYVEKNGDTLRLNGHYLDLERGDEFYRGREYSKDSSVVGDLISITRYNENIEEHFQGDLDGLTYYYLKFGGAFVNEDVGWLLQSKENKNRYDSLIVNFPKWVEQAK